MHVWVIEAKKYKDSDWEIITSYTSRDMARWYSAHHCANHGYYKTRVVKYISTKGE